MKRVTTWVLALLAAGITGCSDNDSGGGTGTTEDGSASQDGTGDAGSSSADSDSGSGSSASTGTTTSTPNGTTTGASTSTDTGTTTGADTDTGTSTDTGTTTGTGTSTGTGHTTTTGTSTGTGHTTTTGNSTGTGTSTTTSTGGLLCPDPPPADVVDVSVDDLYASILAGEILAVVDVRESNETIGGVIEGALLYPWNSGVLQADHADLPSDRPLFVICQSGTRSALASDFLHQNGHDCVHNVLGGMTAWTDVPYPTVPP